MEENTNDVFNDVINDVNSAKVSKSQNVKVTRPYEIIALIAFIMCFISLALALIFDVASFSQVILKLLAAIIVPIILFFLLFILFLASFVLIFGFFLVKEYGFWPLTLSIQIFKEIIGEIVFKPNDIDKFVNMRIILIVLCSLILISAIVSKVLHNVDVKKLNIKPNLKSKKLSTAAIVLSTIGLMTSIGAILIFKSF